MEVTRLSRKNVGGIREAMPDGDHGPRILCWNCKKMTPFQEERCEFCGARFAGSTGGMYGMSRTVTARVPVVPSDDQELAEARRSLLQLFEDLQRVHDVSSAHRYDVVHDEETITLFQCPSCGRFVAEDAADCLCGVHFATDSPESTCPECGSTLPAGAAACPVCASRLKEAPSELMYACPLCGAEVSEDAVRCACGARFEG